MTFAAGMRLGDMTATLDDSAGSGVVITFGQVDAAGVAWRFTTLDGWDSADADEHAESKTGADGAWDSDDYYTGRVITLAGTAQAPDMAARDAAWDQLEQAVPLRGRTVTLTVNETVPKQVTCRRSGRLQMDRTTDTLITFSISLLAVDPRKYATSLSSVGATLGAAGGGIALPLVLPMALPAHDIGDEYFTATNSGTYESPPMVRIAGPGQNLGIANLSTGQSLVYPYELGVGDAMVVDVAAGSALLNGTAYRAPTSSSTVTGRFMLPRGDSRMQFLGTRTDAALSPLLTMTWRAAWM